MGNKLTVRSLLAAFLVAVVVGNVWGQVRYTVTDLGTFSGDADINNNGQVVGCCYATNGEAQALLYSGGTMQDLGTLPGYTSSIAYGINDSGQVVGEIADNSAGYSDAFFYSNGVMHDMATLLPGVGNSCALGINNSGQVVGQATCDGKYYAFLYSNGTVQVLGTLGGLQSEACSINNSGQIVGTSGDQAFLYSGGTMQDLGTLGGRGIWASSINDSGLVVGGAYNASRKARAFLYSNGTMQDLGTLAGYSDWISASSINDSGLIVGSAGNSQMDYHAFLYVNGTMEDLNNLIAPSSNWTLITAQSINDNGWIVGYGTNPSGQTDTFLLTPILTPASYSWTSAVSGNWSDSTKWTGGVPNADGAVAVISASTTAALTITLDAPQTIGTLLLGSGNATTGYTLSGSNTLTFSNTGNNTAATISVTDGTHAINAAVVLASNLVVTSTSSSPWTLNFGTASSITDNGNNLSLTMSASNGTLILSGSDNYTGGTIVTAGMLIVTSNTALPAGSSLTVDAGGTFLFDPSVSGSPLAASQINPVPEPSTLALLGSALLGLGVVYLHRRRAKA